MIRTSRSRECYSLVNKTGSNVHQITLETLKSDVFTAYENDFDKNM